MSENYKSLKVKELQELLQKNGLGTSGKKEELIERLVKYDERKALENLEKEFEMDGDFDESKIILSDLPQDDIFALEKLPIIEKESVLSDDEEVDFIMSERKKPSKPTAAAPKTRAAVKAADTVVEMTESVNIETITASDKKTANDTTTTATSTAPVSNTKVTVTKTAKTVTSATTTVKTSTSSFKFTPITFDKKPNEEGKAVPAPQKPESPVKAPATIAKPDKAALKKVDDQAERLRLEAERRLERSKRFGVKLDEKEMKEIRAARFGLVAEKKEDKKKEDKKKEEAVVEKKKEKKESPEDILKKRAARFGLPEKKVVAAPVEKEAKKKNNNNKNNTNKNQKSDTNKKEVVATPVKKVIKGRVTKPAAQQPAAKNVKLNVTKNNVLDKNKNNINKLNKAGVILQNKKNIINQRKANINNNIGGRVITIASEPATKPKPKPVVAKAVPRVASKIIQNTNGRKVMIASLPTAPINQGRSRNSNNSTTRKRGRGHHGGQQQTDAPNKKRRN